MTFLRHELSLFFTALQFLTRAPVPRWVGFEAEWLNLCVRHFALVGVLIGSWSAAIALVAGLWWSPVVAATLAVAATVWLTVAFHEDGLADTFDALLGAAPREKALAIMKDSRIGSYGAAALLLSLLLRVLLLAELLSIDAWLGAAACIAAHSAGRAAAVALMALLPYAGDEEHAKAKPLARGVRVRDALVSIAIGMAAIAWTGHLANGVPIDSSEPVLQARHVDAMVNTAWSDAEPVDPGEPAQQEEPAYLSGTSSALWAVAGLTIMVLAMRRWLRRRLGGYVGDTLGATEQFGEIAVLLAFTAYVA